MGEQRKKGHEVSLLWPGQMGFFIKQTTVKFRGIRDINGANINSFEVINPLPVPYDEGIADIQKFTEVGNKEIYKAFLNEYKPDVIHVHTFMGLHKNFMTAAKEMGIRTVFSTHDFFPVCPKVTLFKNGDVCKCADSFVECGKCNSSALSINKIRLLQSPLYRALKDSGPVRKLRKRHRDNFFDNVNDAVPGDTVDAGKGTDLKSSDEKTGRYRELRKYYSEMLDLFDFIHFNSSLTERVYRKYFGELKGAVIHISHGDIRDCRKKKSFPGDLIRMRYLGNYSGAKGFFYLRNALDRLWEIRRDFSLDVHFESPEPREYIRTNKRYTYDELEKIFDNTDVLIVPSLWYETFGYTVLEALSYGVPVILTDRVGAGDIVPEGSGIIVDASDKDSLFRALGAINSKVLSECNEAILNSWKIITMEEVADLLEEHYKDNGCQV